jgi:hypothetical protein
VIADDGEAGMLEGIFTGSLAAGDDKARDIVGAARAGLVEAIVTAAITAQAVLALLDTPDGATGEPPRPVTEAP